jgi:hypothetical protein
MCTDRKMMCNCRTHAASFNFRDDILPAEVVNRLYCPNCSVGLDFNPYSMLKDNGWIIEYDMDVAKFMSQKLPAKEVTPEVIFDQGYCTWHGVYPTDHIDALKEREELVKLSKINPRKYFDEIKRWGQERMKRLEAEGWRKANAEQ